VGRGFSILLAVVGLVLIALGVWVTFRFEKTPVPDEAVGPVKYVIQKHPAADAGGGAWRSPGRFAWWPPRSTAGAQSPRGEAAPPEKASARPPTPGSMGRVRHKGRINRRQP
jgi:hypothetical protein